MFARALREFILWPEPCTSRLCMTEAVCVRCTRDPECGVAGTFVCWEAGAYVVVGRNAAASANTRGTEGGGLQAVQGRSRQGEEDPRGRRQGEVFGAMGELCSGSDVQ
jgi:hypothetical protein